MVAALVMFSWAKEELTKIPTDADIDNAMAEIAINKIIVFINDRTKLCAINVLRMDTVSDRKYFE